MGWSDKYKKSINCNNPKGFSQKAHCAGRKIRKENMKLSELKNIIKDLIQERSINAISKAQEKNATRIKDTLELYKKAKGGNDAYKKKNIIKVLYKLNDEKKKLEKEMDDKISSLYKNADYKGPIDESIELGKVYPNPYATAFKPESQIKEEENSVNEMQVVNKKTGKDITRHVLDLLKGKIDKKKFEKLTGLKKESVNERINPKFYDARVQYIDPRSKKKFVGDVVRYDNGEYKVNLGKDGRFEKYILAKEKDLKIVSKSTKRTFESVNEEADDHEVGMGLSSLKSSVRSAKIIYDNIKKRNIEELDGWVQEKLTLASDYLKNVADYMEDLDEYDKDGTSNN
jgi:hypothetical protein